MPQLFQPKTEPGYPPNCITVEGAIDAIRKIYGKPGWRIERFKIEGITDKEGTIKLSFDRKNVGQPTSVEAAR